MQPNQNKLVDLTGEPSSRLQNAAFNEVRDLVRGATVTLLTGEEPSLLMRTINLHLRDNLSWETVQDGECRWRTLIRPREDTAPSGIVDVLVRDHKRLDDLFARALHLANAGDVAGAAPLLRAFAEGLRRHIDVENNILTTSFQAPRDPFGSDPTSTMLREHDEILGQTAVLESYFEDGLPDAKEVSAFFAILSGTLAKHEYREETNLFPFWGAAMAKAPESARQILMEKVQAMLAASGGEMPEKL
jgi:hemerythrin-like domain-containing protein